MSKSISKYHIVSMIVSMFVFLLSLPVAVFFVMDNRVRVEFKALGFCILAGFFWIILCVLLIIPFFLIKEASLKAKDGSSEDIDFLINIVINKNNFYDYAARCLSSFQSSQAINLFCNKWVDNRNILLTKILVKARYIATQPSKNRMLTALKVNKFQDCVSQDYHLVKDLLEAFEDQDIEIASRAKKYAINLSSQETIDYLFFLFFEENNQVAYQVIQQANYQATQANYKALFYILRSEWEAYEALDFDQVLLQGVYQSAAPELRKEIADKARQRGWTEWLTFASQKGKNLENMTKEEWDVTLTILKNNRNYEEMWRLVNQAPVWLCWELLVELSRCLWRSSHGYQETFEGLLALANQCSQIKIRDITNSGQLIFSVDGTYKKVKISTNGKFLATYNYYDENENEDEETYYKNLKMWRIEDSQLHFSFDEIYKEISADGQFLITYNTYDTYEYKETEIRRIENGRLLFSVDGEYQEISADGQFLITYDGAKT